MKTISHSNQLVHEFSRTVADVVVPGGGLHLLPQGGSERLEVMAGGRKAVFPIKAVLNPSRRLLDDRELTGAEPTLLLCPHIPTRLAADLARAGVNHADLNGRLFLSGKGFHWDREPKSIFYRAAQAVEPALFSPRTTRIIRALLAQRDRESWTQAELLERTQVASGLISRTLEKLVRERFLTVEASAKVKRYRLQDFDALLDHWREADVWWKRVTVRQYSLLERNETEIAARVINSLGAEEVVFTQWWAAWLRRPHTTPPLVSVYVRAGTRLPQAREVNSGGNLWLVEPEDEGVFQETQVVHGYRLAADVQIYLDLIGQGQRGPEAAVELRAWEGFGR
jgi:hypothetical protein